MVAAISSQNPKVITGRRLKDRSIKIVEEAPDSFCVVYTRYFLSKVIWRKKWNFDNLREAEMCYEKMGIEKFKGIF